MGTYAVYDRHSRPTPTTTPSIPRQLDSLVVLLPAVPHHRQLPQVRHSPSPSGFGTANPCKTSAAPVKHPGAHVFLHATRPHKFSSINKLTFCAVGHAHDRSAEDQEPQGPSLQAHSRVHNSCPRVIELLPPSDHHDQNIFCFSSRCSTTTSTPVQKASTPSLSSRSAVSSANQVGRLATRVCAEKREQTSTSQPARKAKDGAYWVCSCTTKLMIASPTRP